MQLTQAQAGEFYAVHRERPFYGELVIHDLRPLHADGAREGGRRAGAARRDRRDRSGRGGAGTVRKLYAESKGRNAIHASDSDENAAREARFFFAETELRSGAEGGTTAHRAGRAPSALISVGQDSFRGYAVL